MSRSLFLQFWGVTRGFFCQTATTQMKSRHLQPSWVLLILTPLDKFWNTFEKCKKVRNLAPNPESFNIKCPNVGPPLPLRMVLLSALSIATAEGASIKDVHSKIGFFYPLPPLSEVWRHCYSLLCPLWADPPSPQPRTSFMDAPRGFFCFNWKPWSYIIRLSALSQNYCFHDSLSSSPACLLCYICECVSNMTIIANARNTWMDIFRGICSSEPQLQHLHFSSTSHAISPFQKEKMQQITHPTRIDRHIFAISTPSEEPT